ncbi:glycoprotease family-domain-containing protein [Annulohypoxylon maeteangense]|uniref:glycoprotease family-domain-containing protein n=1 Tax=Annulohypoxylon maeteangense TaxID=1927788 RepID=UPI0020081771|nr:glycoprotease family-domain-containing protein [Annulohypoxylon maeteangense]KAI0889138.1 glycoprotease family-domain-containing protein [Annulohypoxylon maeteangense]
MSATSLLTTRSYSLSRAHHKLCLLSQPHLSLPTSHSPRCQRFSSQPTRRRRLLTLAIESSCDDTCVAVLEKDTGPKGAAYLLTNKKTTSANRSSQGVHPLIALASHTEHIAGLIREAIRALPKVSEKTDANLSSDNRDINISGKEDVLWVDGQARRKPDFVAVTRGPGMLSSLSTGLNLAKGLAVAWDVPLLGVNHMQAHALTPRLVSALEAGKQEQAQKENGKDHEPTPTFPFLSLLVSGGHSLLVLSRTLTDHAILAQSHSIAIGDMIDKCARDILPPSLVAAGGDTVVYGALLERFAFPAPDPSDADNTEADTVNYDYTPPAKRGDEIRVFDSEYGWSLRPPLAESRKMVLDFGGINGAVLEIVLRRPDMDVAQRRVLARETMRLSFEHLASRVIFALEKSEGKGGDGSLRDVSTLVVAGGVSSNRYLMHILRAVLDVRGYGHIEIVSPPLALCTDNAAMIAWAGMEMYEAGWRTGLDVLPIRKWPLDPTVDGGILGVKGWKNVGEML